MSVCSGARRDGVWCLVLAPRRLGEAASVRRSGPSAPDPASPPCPPERPAGGGPFLPDPRLLPEPRPGGRGSAGVTAQRAAPVAGRRRARRCAASAPPAACAGPGPAAGGGTGAVRRPGERSASVDPRAGRDVGCPGSGGPARLRGVGCAVPTPAAARRPGVPALQSGRGRCTDRVLPCRCRRCIETAARPGPRPCGGAAGARFLPRGPRRRIAALQAFARPCAGGAPGRGVAAGGPVLRRRARARDGGGGDPAHPPIPPPDRGLGAAAAWR